MKLAFILSMPGVGSWNGKWSGESTLYAVVEDFKTLKRLAKASAVLERRPYFYRWDDGWCARIDVRQVDNAEARKLKQESKGFCGYEWMIVSILERGKILADHEVEEAAPQLSRPDADEKT